MTKDEVDYIQGRQSTPNYDYIRYVAQRFRDAFLSITAEDPLKRVRRDRGIVALDNKEEEIEVNKEQVNYFKTFLDEFLTDVLYKTIKRDTSRKLIEINVDNLEQTNLGQTKSEVKPCSLDSGEC